MAADQPVPGPEPRLRLREEDLASRGFDEETVVLDLRSSTYLAANATGSVLWRELERGTRRSALIETLLAEFEVDRARAATDVDEFLEDCRRRRLLIEELVSDESRPD